MTWIKSQLQLKKIINHWLTVLVLSALWVCAWQLPIVFAANHVAFNLEPYPDGLYYLQIAKSITTQGSFLFDIKHPDVLPAIPLGYPLWLAFWWLIWDSSKTFLLANLVSGLLTLLGTWLLAKKISNSNGGAWIAWGLLATNSVWLWFLGLPMAENLGLGLTVFLVWGCLNTDWFKSSQLTSWLKWWLLSLGALLLVLIKFIYLPISIIFVLWIGWNILTQHGFNRKILAQWLVVHLILLMAWFGAEMVMGRDRLEQLALPASSFTAKSDNSVSTTNARFWSPNFFSRNLKEYSGLLAGHAPQLLWVRPRFVSPFLTIWLGIGWLALLAHRRPAAGWIGLLSIFQFVLLGMFYTADARYSIHLFPLYLAISGAGFAWFAKKNIFADHWMIMLGILTAASQIFAQLSFTKVVVTQNFFQSSTAWQKIATTRILEQAAKNPPDFIMTAIPPYLFWLDEPQMTKTLLTPLSDAQEFRQKGEPVWDSISPEQDISAWVAQQLAAHKTIWISNAYVTHQKQVIDDYEALKKQFSFELIYSGCHETCNLYHLKQI